MQYPRNIKLTPNARTLRKNMTKQERHLWYDFLRYCKPRFRRQEIIGSYIADFFCHEAKLVVELDGSQHYESEVQEADQVRTAYFHTLGIRVLRFSNADVNTNFDRVCNGILLALETCGITARVNFEDSASDPSVTAKP